MYQISLNQNMHQLLKKITLFQNPLPHNCHETCNKMLVKSIYTKTCYTKYPTLTLFLQTHKSKLNFGFHFEHHHIMKELSSIEIGI
jgi:hypothetical protein